MAYRPKQAGTTSSSFEIGLDKVTVASPSGTTKWTITLPTGPGSSGLVLTTDGSGNTTWTTNGAAAQPNIQVFTTSGTWTKPSGKGYTEAFGVKYPPTAPVVLISSSTSCIAFTISDRFIGFLIHLLIRSIALKILNDYRLPFEYFLLEQ